MENSPKREELTGFLHGHPVTDETGDQTGGETEDKKGDDSEKSSSDRQTDKDEQQSVKTKKNNRQVRSSSLLPYLLFIIVTQLIFHDHKFSMNAAD